MGQHAQESIFKF